MSTPASLQKTAAKSSPLATAKPLQIAGANVFLQRKCACGAGTSNLTGECEACSKNKTAGLQTKLRINEPGDAYEQEADRVAAQVLAKPAHRDVRSAPQIQRFSGQPNAETAAAPARVQHGFSDPGFTAPPIVDQVLARPGQALDPDARQFFEQRFVRDFGRVRVHADAQAAASARAVDAHAYTVGNHVVFGASRYAPNTAAGRRLLAHELTHVVQQGAMLRRASMSPPVEGELHRDDEDKQPVQQLQRHVAIVGLEEAGPKADLTGKQETQIYQLSERDKKLAECKKAAGPDPLECDPATPPGWGSFTATPVASSPFGAVTASSIKAVDVPSQKCEETITGSASGPTKRFQGVFTPDKSWVKARSRDAADPTKNGSAAQVANCEAAFNALAPGQTAWWALNTAVDPACPASARPRGDRANTKAECATIVAKDFNDWAVAESTRLLTHEQNHFALTCAMAKKGNAALAAGNTFAAIDAVIHTKLATAQSQYDTQSQHSCNAAQQSAWETKIAAGLPDIKLP
jgi:hypothetical protein